MTTKTDTQFEALQPFTVRKVNVGWVIEQKSAPYSGPEYLPGFLAAFDDADQMVAWIIRRINETTPRPLPERD